MSERPGHVHVVGGDIRRLACDAWALPADGSGQTEPAWLAWPPGAADAVASPTPFAHWTREAPRALPVAGWPANLPAAWKLHVELAPSVPSSWLVEAALTFVEAAAELTRQQGRRIPGEGPPLVALPLGVPGIGAAEGEQARRAAGRLARELVPELQVVAEKQGIEVALVAHSADSLAAARAARAQVGGGGEPLPDHILRGLEPVRAALARDSLALCVGPAPARRAGLPSLPALLRAAADDAELSEAWRDSLPTLPLDAQARLVARHVGGRGALARRIAAATARAHVSLEHLLVAGQATALVIGEGPDDQLEQAFAAAGLPLDDILDGGSLRREQSRGAGLLLRQGTARKARSLVELLQDPGRRRQRDRTLLAAARAALPADAHLLVIGHVPGPALLDLLGELAPLLTAGSGPHVTVLLEGAPGALAELWPAGQVRWLSLDEGVDLSAERDAPGRADARRGRLLARCLDHLATVGARGRDLLAPDRLGLLSDADRALSQGIADMLARLPAKARDATLWPELAAWLQAHGHPAE